MTALAILTGDHGNCIPSKYEYHFLGTHHVYEYNTLRISEFSDEELENSENPFAVVILAARKALLTGKIPEKALMEEKLLLARMLLGKKRFPRAKIKKIMAFLKKYISLSDDANNLILDQQLKESTYNSKSMDIFEAVAYIEELELGEKINRSNAERLLAQTDLSMEKIASVLNVSVYFVKKVRKETQARPVNTRVGASA